jgi:hypothetical protein
MNGLKQGAAVSQDTSGLNIINIYLRLQSWINMMLWNSLVLYIVGRFIQTVVIYNAKLVKTVNASTIKNHYRQRPSVSTQLRKCWRKSLTTGSPTGYLSV